MDKKPPFKLVLADLSNVEKIFPPAHLRSFSDLDGIDLKEFEKAWPSIPIARKISLLDDLEDLAESDTTTSFESITRFLLTDPDPQVRQHAIRLLWESEDPRLAYTFMKMVESDADEQVQASAVNALGQFIYLGELDKIPASLHHKIEDFLLEVMASSTKNLVKHRALESLGYSSRDEVNSLIESAYSEKKPDWIVSALFAMGRSCDDRWKKQVLSHLHSADDDIRSEAIHAAGELELGAARPILLDLLQDEEDTEIRRELIWALATIGGEGIRAKLEELLELEEDDIEADFIEDALATGSFTEDITGFSLIDVDPDLDFIEEDPDDRRSAKDE